VGEHESLSKTAATPEQQAARVIVSSLDGVTWVRRSAGPVTILPPDLDARVVRALDALGVGGMAATRASWQVTAAEDADFVFLFGPRASDVAHAISAAGNGHRVVLCASSREAERAARIMALPGDFVLQEADGLVLYPGVGTEGDPTP
jgi:hypothetical protein